MSLSLCFIATMKNNLTCLSRVKLLKWAVLLSIGKLNYYFGEHVATRPDHMQTSTFKSAVCMQPCDHHLFSAIIKYTMKRHNTVYFLFSDFIYWWLNMYNTSCLSVQRSVIGQGLRCWNCLSGAICPSSPYRCAIGQGAGPWSASKKGSTWEEKEN